MALYLGLDSSTQSLSAVVIDLDARDVVLDHSINFDERLKKFGCKNGVLPNDDPQVAHSDPLLWLAALDLLCSELPGKGIDLSQIVAVAGSGQQHGSVYLKPKATEVLKKLNPKRSLAAQIKPALSRPSAPIWMDSSTNAECRAIEEALGGVATIGSPSEEDIKNLQELAGQMAQKIKSNT